MMEIQYPILHMIQVYEEISVYYIGARYNGLSRRENILFKYNKNKNAVATFLIKNINITKEAVVAIFLLKHLSFLFKILI